MRNIFLIFRRDYLGYVKAWGFWLSLAAVPMFMIIGGLLGMYAATSSPVRYYTAIETGSTFSDAIESEFARGEADEAKQAAEMLDGMNIAPDMSESEKAEMLTSDEDRKFIRVAPPASQSRSTRTPPRAPASSYASVVFPTPPLAAATVTMRARGEAVIGLCVSARMNSFLRDCL